MSSFLWYAFCGVISSAASGLLVFILAPKSRAVSVYLWPGMHVAPLLARLVPIKIMSWVVPEGGPPAYLLLVLVGSFLSWAVLFGLATLAVHLMMRRKLINGVQRIAEEPPSR
jgi:hypothetical protein